MMTCGDYGGGTNTDAKAVNYFHASTSKVWSNFSVDHELKPTGFLFSSIIDLINWSAGKCSNGKWEEFKKKMKWAIAFFGVKLT